MIELGLGNPFSFSSKVHQFRFPHILFDREFFLSKHWSRNVYEMYERVYQQFKQFKHIRFVYLILYTNFITQQSKVCNGKEIIRKCNFRFSLSNQYAILTITLK